MDICVFIWLVLYSKRAVVSQQHHCTVPVLAGAKHHKTVYSSLSCVRKKASIRAGKRKCLGGTPRMLLVEEIEFQGGKGCVTNNGEQFD